MSGEQFDPAHAMALHDRLMWMAKGWPLKVSADEIAAKTDELRNYLNKAAPQPPADMKPLPPEIGEIVARRLGDMQEGPSYEAGNPVPTDKEIVLPPIPDWIPDGIVSHESIREYGAACRAAALEEAAKVCDKLAALDSTDWHSPICAAAIRALKDGK